MHRFNGNLRCIRIEIEVIDGISEIVFLCINDRGALHRLCKRFSSYRNQAGCANRTAGRSGDFHQAACGKATVETDIDIAALCNHRRRCAVAGIRCFAVGSLKVCAPCERRRTAAHVKAIEVAEAGAAGILRGEVNLRAIDHDAGTNVACCIAVHSGKINGAAGSCKVRDRTPVEFAAVTAKVDIVTNHGCASPIEAIGTGCKGLIAAVADLDLIVRLCRVAAPSAEVEVSAVRRDRSIDLAGDAADDRRMLHARCACVIGLDAGDLLERRNLCISIDILQRAVAAGQLDRQRQRLRRADIAGANIDVVVDIIVILVARDLRAGVDRLLVHHDIRAAVRAACNQVQRHVCAAAGDLRRAGNADRAAVRNRGLAQVDASRNTVAARGNVGNIERLGQAGITSSNRVAAGKAGITVGFCIGCGQIDGIARAVRVAGNQQRRGKLEAGSTGHLLVPYENAIVAVDLCQSAAGSMAVIEDVGVGHAVNRPHDRNVVNAVPAAASIHKVNSCDCGGSAGRRGSDCGVVRSRIAAVAVPRRGSCGCKCCYTEQHCKRQKDCQYSASSFHNQKLLSFAEIFVPRGFPMQSRNSPALGLCHSRMLQSPYCRICERGFPGSVFPRRAGALRL